jgi:hypothetical protein
MTCTQVGFGWSTSTWSPLSFGIRYFTRPRYRPWPLAGWSHMFLVFQFDDGSVWMHEALGSGGWQAHSIRKLHKWADESPKYHRYQIHMLPLPCTTAAAIYSASAALLGKASYAYKQIFAFAAANSVIGRWLGLSVAAGPASVICSEGVCRLVGQACPEFDLRRTSDQSWDSVSPQSAYEEFERRTV